jgi:16S rRNA (guanine966-N2)-methyltransferase
VRVIAGSAKGTRLAAVPSGVRPVSDRAREGLFSSLGDRVVDAAVLDLFAGTGALGIEALSRGADSAVFVDQAPRAVAAIRGNLERTRLGERGRVVRSDVERFLEADLERPFDLVFVDPPYALAAPAIARILGRLLAGDGLAAGGSVLLTRDIRSSEDVIPVDWVVAKRLVYGDSVLTLLRKQPRTTEE